VTTLCSSVASDVTYVKRDLYRYEKRPIQISKFDKTGYVTTQGTVSSTVSVDCPRVAVCCSVLQCVAVCCSVLQCVAVSDTGQSGLSSTDYVC